MVIFNSQDAVEGETGVKSKTPFEPDYEYQ